jgi:DNA primase small subunit
VESQSFRHSSFFSLVFFPLGRKGFVVPAKFANSFKWHLVQSTHKSLDMSDIPELRHLYYSRLFPVQSLLHWLKDDNPLTNREFSFLVGDEIILRYLSFEDEKAFGEALSKKNPYKIDVGAIYSSPPNQKDKSISFVPLRKEFVLDMDINVYDDVRHCCQQTAICLKCWPLIQAGMHVLDLVGI